MGGTGDAVPAQIRLERPKQRICSSRETRQKITVTWKRRTRCKRLKPAQARLVQNDKACRSAQQAQCRKVALKEMTQIGAFDPINPCQRPTAKP